MIAISINGAGTNKNERVKMIYLPYLILLPA